MPWGRPPTRIERWIVAVVRRSPAPSRRSRRLPTARRSPACARRRPRRSRSGSPARACGWPRRRPQPAPQASSARTAAAVAESSSGCSCARSKLRLDAFWLSRGTFALVTAPPWAGAGAASDGRASREPTRRLGVRCMVSWASAPPGALTIARRSKAAKGLPRPAASRRAAEGLCGAVAGMTGERKVPGSRPGGGSGRSPPSTGGLACDRGPRPGRTRPGRRARAGRLAPLRPLGPGPSTTRPDRQAWVAANVPPSSRPAHCAWSRPTRLRGCCSCATPSNSPTPARCRCASGRCAGAARGTSGRGSPSLL